MLTSLPCLIVGDLITLGGGGGGVTKIIIFQKCVCVWEGGGGHNKLELSVWGAQ